MPQLEVPGASLYYETIGEGPLFVCVSGANGSADIWRPLSRRLSRNFKVAMYDRRGFSRSILIGAQDYEHRIETDADDIQRLIHHLGSGEPATVLGSSSGALVALTLLLRHPDDVRKLLCHEPPAIKLLPDYDELVAEQRDIYQTYRRSGVAPAVEKFAAYIKAGAEAPGLIRFFDPASGSYAFANSMYWLERELPEYIKREVDVEALAEQRNKLVLLNGLESDSEALQYRPNVLLSEKLGLELHLMPGAHVGYAMEATKFADLVYDTLKDKDSSY